MVCFFYALYLIIPFCLIGTSIAPKDEPTDFLDELWHGLEETANVQESQPQSDHSQVIGARKIKAEPLDDEQCPKTFAQASAQVEAVKVENGFHDGAVKLEPRTLIKPNIIRRNDQEDVQEFAGQGGQEFTGQSDQEFTDQSDQEFTDQSDQEFTNESDQEFVDQSDQEFTEQSDQEFTDQSDQEFTDQSDQENRIKTNQSSDTSEKNQKIFSKKYKKKMVDRFEKIKNKYPQMSNEKIAQKLGINRVTLFNWRKLYQAGYKRIHKYSSSEKNKIIKKYYEMKEEYKRTKSDLKAREIEAKIVMKLGVSKRTLYTWRHNKGLTGQKSLSKNEKCRIVKSYVKLKKQNPKMKMNEIANTLGICKSTLCEWRKLCQPEYKPKKKNSKKEKYKIVQLFLKRKKELLSAGQNAKNNKDLDAKIAKEFGVSHWTIYDWKKAFGLNASTDIVMLSNAKKRFDFVRQFYSIKKENSSIRLAEAAKILKVNERSLRRWKLQFDTDKETDQSKEDDTDHSTDKETDQFKEDGTDHFTERGFDHSEDDNAEYLPPSPKNKAWSWNLSPNKKRRLF